VSLFGNQAHIGIRISLFQKYPGGRFQYTEFRILRFVHLSEFWANVSCFFLFHKSNFTFLFDTCVKTYIFALIKQVRKDEKNLFDSAHSVFPSSLRSDNASGVPAACKGTLPANETI
jgi:hypothetical protein